MGGGEFIPNDSMHWTIAEEDVVEQGGKVQRSKSRPDMKGRDPINLAHLGKGKGQGSHDDHLLVTLKFKDQAEADAALQAAISGGKVVGGDYEVEIKLRPIKRTRQQADHPYPNPFAQVSVDW